MKKIILFLGLTLIAVSCSDDDSGNGNVPADGNNVLLLQVDYASYAFEGGRELNFADASDFTITHEYNSPGDFGDITLLYEEVNDTIFSGTIVWDGAGEITHPESMAAPTTFDTGSAIATPPASDFIFIDYMAEDSENPTPQEINHEAIWAAISNLDKVAEYRAANPEAKIHLLMYARSVGMFLPANADWIVILKN